MINDGPARISLREVTENDLLVLYEHQKDPASVEMANVPARDLEAHLAHWHKILDDATVMKRTVVFNDEVAGHVVSWEQDGHRNTGYWLGKEFWGKGIATAALSQFLEIDSTRPLHAYVSNHNVGSLRVLEKCGFTIQLESEVEKHLLLRD